jgi:hypothetical protein
MRLVLVAFVSLVAAVTSFAQTTWYVDGQNCSGTGTGTAADPFCRIQQGVDAATDGDVVLVMAGTYHEGVLVSAVGVCLSVTR